MARGGRERRCSRPAGRPAAAAARGRPRAGPGGGAGGRRGWPEDVGGQAEAGDRRQPMSLKVAMKVSSASSESPLAQASMATTPV